jgi:hypothetical protein
MGAEARYYGLWNGNVKLAELVFMRITRRFMPWKPNADFPETGANEH